MNSAMARWRMLCGMQKERLTVSLDTGVAARVRQCGARSRGGASGYLERLVRQDQVKEAAAAMGRWYEAQADTETDAFLDAVETELAALDPDGQQAALQQLGLDR
ncbi:MAG: hypothetical protein ACR2G2_02840 [Pseudonocardia sp.]